MPNDLGGPILYSILFLVNSDFLHQCETQLCEKDIFEMNGPGCEYGSITPYSLFIGPEQCCKNSEKDLEKRRTEGKAAKVGSQAPKDVIL